ncbi:MAG: RluA family pseudouridine synthase [Candidatus Omnitrophica bacterium]|jgi:RluA family pseudouridine synthase|nr:RluA family pseudouridine synthase [Candidatus Omnitrophota bacterium]
MNIPVIYHDKWFLVVDKPSGLLTVPTAKKESRTLSGILNQEFPDPNSHLYPCHRLDRDTSGLIIYAHGKLAREKMEELFRARKLKKTYIAFAQGDFKTAQGVIDRPIEGLRSITEYKVLEKSGIFNLVQVYPATGRTNQIRIHFKAIGCPILGDTKFYFRRDFKIKAKRLCLHAYSIEFIHPFNNEKISLTCDLPDPMQKMLDKLC